MKKFISVLLSLAMIFSAFGAVNANAASSQDTYNAYKSLIESNRDYYKKNSYVTIDYVIYDIDKDGSPELIMFTQNYDSDSSSAVVYTYKDNKATLCAKLYGENPFSYNTVCENRYGNGVGLSGGTGGGWLFKFYVLNGTKLSYTGNSFQMYPGNDSMVYRYNGKTISENTAKTYFPINWGGTTSDSKLTYLKQSFNM